MVEINEIAEMTLRLSVGITKFPKMHGLNKNVLPLPPAPWPSRPCRFTTGKKQATVPHLKKVFFGRIVCLRWSLVNIAKTYFWLLKLSQMVGSKCMRHHLYFIAPAKIRLQCLHHKEVFYLFFASCLGWKSRGYWKWSTKGKKGAATKYRQQCKSFSLINLSLSEKNYLSRSCPRFWSTYLCSPNPWIVKIHKFREYLTTFEITF